jgi:hypothetical protein
MKPIAIVLPALFAAGCVDGRDSAEFVTVTSPGAPQLRFEGLEGAISVEELGTVALITYRGRTIRYDQGALLIDDRRLPVPGETRVVKFDGLQIYFDGRSVDSL